MEKRIMVGGLVVAVHILGVPGALAGPWEDGMATYNRGDYVPAIPLFRPFAEQGNPKPQDLFGVMYRRGQGVARNPMRAFAWFSSAAARGDAKAKVALHAVSRTMTREEVSQAREMAQACEASNYRNCEY